MSRGQKRIERYEILEVQQQCMAGTAAEAELTGAGCLFSAGLGFLETFAVLAIGRIELVYVPFLVFLVLWAGFGIITSSCVYGLGYICISCENMKADRHAGRHGVPDIAAGMKDSWKQKEVWNMKKAS